MSPSIYNGNVGTTVQRAFTSMTREHPDPILQGMRADLAQMLLFDDWRKGDLSFAKLRAEDPEREAAISLRLALAGMYDAIPEGESREATRQLPELDLLLTERNAFLLEVLEANRDRDYPAEVANQLDDIDRRILRVCHQAESEALRDLWAFLSVWDVTDAEQVTIPLQSQRSARPLPLVSAKQAFSNLVGPDEDREYRVCGQSRMVGPNRETLRFGLETHSGSLSIDLSVMRNEVIGERQYQNCYVQWKERGTRGRWLASMTVLDKQNNEIALVDMTTVTPELKQAVEGVAITLLSYKVEPLLALDPRWRTSDVVGVARGIREERAFERLPILADALMDAGFDDGPTLALCQRGGAAPRAGWLLDEILGEK